MFGLFKKGPQSKDVPNQEPKTLWFHEQSEEYKKTVREQAKAKVVAEFRAIVEQDKIEAEQAKNNPPEFEIGVIGYQTGKFLKYEKEEIQLKYIEDITITNPGSLPWIDSYDDYFDVPEYCVRENPGEITVRMISGHRYTFYTKRFLVCQLYDTLVSVWKNGVSPWK